MEQYTLKKGAYYAELIWDYNEYGYKDHYHYELTRVETEKPVIEIKSIFPNKGDETSLLYWESKEEMIKWADNNKHTPMFGFPSIIILIRRELGLNEKVSYRNTELISDLYKAFNPHAKLS